MSPKYVSFGEAIALYFKNYVNFQGRSTRSEYWWAALFNFLVTIALNIMGAGMTTRSGSNPLATLYSIAVFLPSLALCIRRLHDIGKSWVWYLFALIPFVGWIFLIVWFCRAGEPTVNQWGWPAEMMDQDGMGAQGADPRMYSQQQMYGQQGYDQQQMYGQQGYNQQAYGQGFDPQQNYDQQMAGQQGADMQRGYSQEMYTQGMAQNPYSQDMYAQGMAQNPYSQDMYDQGMNVQTPNAQQVQQAPAFEGQVYGQEAYTQAAQNVQGANPFDVDTQENPGPYGTGGQ